MKKIGINFSIRDISNFLNFYIDAIFNNSKYENKYKIAKKYYLDIDKSNKLKSIINTYLKNNNKKILFIIDNIERADKDNINLLFKLVNNIFNFDNVIYLLSFDDNRMKEIFKNDFNSNYKYLKKIIQLEVKVPKIDEDVMKDVVSICIKNLMKLYEIDFNEKDNEETIELLAQRIKDLRELKIYLNSVISFNHVLNNNLNIQDTMLLELIKSQNVELYEEIWRNRQYFISEDTTIFGKSYNYGIREFNIKAKKYFASLFDSQTNEEYKEILAFMFPYVENYLNDREVRTENAQYFNGKEGYQTNLKNKRIFNARYFELYFSQSNNEFTTINKIVEEFVKAINNEKNIEIIYDTFGEVINLYTNWIQKFTFETLQLYLNEIKPKYLLLKIINTHLKEYDDTAIFFGLSALRRICIIMAELITEISKEEFDEFTKNMENDYSKIWIIKEIMNWIENGKNRFKEESKYRKDRFNSILTKMAENVFTNNIDILNKNCYFPNNLNAIFEIVKDDNKKRKEYIKNILDQENVFRFLNEILGRSIGSFRIWLCYKRISNRRIFKCRRSR